MSITIQIMFIGHANNKALVLQVTAKGNNNTKYFIIHCFYFIELKGSLHFIKKDSFVLEVFPQQCGFKKECMVTVTAPEKCSINSRHWQMKESPH